MLLLAESGDKGLTIDNLTSRLDVTKGSFYHHFGGYAGYKSALLAYFERAGVLDIIDRAETAVSAAQKLRSLTDIIATEVAERPIYSRIETALRTWALQDEEVRQFMQQIDAQRLAYVARQCREITGSDTQGQLMAELLYTIFVGSAHTVPPLAAQRLAAYFAEFLRLYGLEE